MEKLSAKKKVSVVRLYLSGLSYEEIAAKSGVSKGTVANVVAELKAGAFPEATDLPEQVDLLRELSRDLKHSGLSPGQCAVGLAVLSRIKECGLDAADIDRLPPILKVAGGEEKAKEFVELVYRIQEVQKKTGLSLDELDNKVHELERKAADLEPMSGKFENCQKQLAALTKRREELAGAVANLEQKYELLNPRVKDLEKRERDLSGRNKDMETSVNEAETILTTLSKEKQRLQKVGLSHEALAEFSQRVQSIAKRHNIAPMDLRDKLLQVLEKVDEIAGIDILVLDRQSELEQRERAIDLTRQEEESLKEATSSLKKEKASLESGIRETREKISREIAKIVPAASKTIEQLLGELRSGYAEALRQLKKQEKEHARVIEPIREEEASIKTIIQVLSEQGQMAIKEVQKKALTAVEEAAQSMGTELKEWGDARAELAAYLEDLQRARYFTRLPLSKEALQAFISDTSPLIVGQYLQISAMWCLKNLNPKLRPPTWITKKYFRVDEYSEIELADLARWSSEAFIEGVGKNERRA